MPETPLNLGWSKLRTAVLVNSATMFRVAHEFSINARFISPMSLIVASRELSLLEQQQTFELQTFQFSSALTVCLRPFAPPRSVSCLSYS